MKDWKNIIYYTALIAVFLIMGIEFLILLSSHGFLPFFTTFITHSVWDTADTTIFLTIATFAVYFLLIFQGELLREATTKPSGTRKVSLIFTTSLSIILSIITLYVISRYNYTLFHGLVEIFSIVISVGIFVVAWNTRLFQKNGYLLLLGIGFLFVGFVDILHTLSYKGIGAFAGADAGLASDLWIIARYIQAFTLLIAPFFLLKNISAKKAVTIYFSITTIALLSIYQGVFPATFIEGSGLTAFKIASEYVISTVLVLAIVITIKKGHLIERPIIKLLVWSMAITILSEMSFTLYTDVYGFSNMVGHLLKIVAYYLIYVAMIKTNLIRPFESLRQEISLREKINQSLLETSSEMSAMSASIQDALIMMGSKGEILFWNPAAKNIFGYTEEEAMGKDLHRLIAPERFHEEFRKGFKHFNQSGEGPAVGKTLELVGKRRNGEEFPIELSLSAIKINGKWNSVGVVRDITERKRTENLLRTSESHLRTLVKTIPDLIWLKDTSGVYLSCNQMFERFFGKKEAEIIGKTDYDFVNKELADFFRANDKRAMDTGGPSINEEWITFADDGHRALLETTKTPLLNGEGKIIGILGIGHDITERKRNEEAVERSERSLAEAQRMAHLGSWELDLVKNVLTWSEENYHIFGFENTKFGATYEAFLETIHPDDRELVNKIYTESVKTHIPYNIDHRLLMRDGTVKYVNERCETFYDESGKPIRSVGTTYDITDRKLAEKEIQEQQRFSQSLLRLSKSLEGSYTYAEVLNSALREVKESIGYQGLWAYLLTEDKKHFKIFGASGENSDVITSEEGTATLTIEGDPMLEEIVAAKDIIIVEDARTDERTNKEMVARSNTRTIINIPIILSGKTLGCVGTGTFGEEGVRVPTDSEQKYLMALVGHIAAALDRIRLFDEIKLSKQKVERLSSLYATLSLCNQAIVHSNNKEELFIQVCRAAVESGGFKMAWIGLIDNENKRITPAYSHGDETGYLKDIQVSSKDDTPFGRGPTGTSVRESKPYWCQDFNNDPNTEVWREAGRRAGWKSSAALPIYEKGKVVGSITLYSDIVNGFDESARNLLMEMSFDVSFALDNFIDRAEKNELEADLAEGKVQDEALLSSLGEGMIAIDTEGKIITMNRMAEKMLGWSKEEVLGKVATDVILAVDDKGEAIPSKKRICLMVANGRNNEPLSCTSYLVRKDGGRVPVSENATPVIIDGKNTGAVIIFRDTTHEMELEETRRDLLSLASHQLRTPLSGTKWLIETLIKGIHGPLTDAQEDYLNEIYKINERMTTLVQDMLGVLRMESGTIPIKTTKISTSGVVATLMANFSPAAKSKLLTLDSEEEADFVVETDQTLLQSILDSLISNAITYSPPGKRVLLSTKKIDNKILFSVKDSGIGIPKNEQTQIYDRFYRASNAKTFNTKGTGLGLYIAATLAKKIGAEISFESRENEGSTFFVSLPASTAESLSV